MAQKIPGGKMLGGLVRGGASVMSGASAAAGGGVAGAVAGVAAIAGPALLAVGESFEEFPPFAEILPNKIRHINSKSLSR